VSQAFEHSLLDSPADATIGENTEPAKTSADILEKVVHSSQPPAEIAQLRVSSSAAVVEEDRQEHAVNDWAGSPAFADDTSSDHSPAMRRLLQMRLNGRSSKTPSAMSKDQLSGDAPPSFELDRYEVSERPMSLSM